MSGTGGLMNYRKCMIGVVKGILVKEAWRA